MRRWHRLTAMTRHLLAVAAVGALVGCGQAAASPARTPELFPAPTGVVPSLVVSPTTSSGPTSGAGTTPPSIQLSAVTLPWHLDRGISRAVAFDGGGLIIIAGGLTASGTTGVVRSIDPVNGHVRRSGLLRDPVHDAAAAVLGGHMLVFGGGRTVPVDTVQRVEQGAAGTNGTVVGRLPAARADLAVVVLGDNAFVIGGGAGGASDARIWATRDGTQVRLAGRLRIGVRYAAVVASGTSIFVFGGAAVGGDRSEIQRFDPATGQTRVVGRLPIRLSHASAVLLGGHVFILGGRVSGRASDTIWLFDPQTATATRVGRLPYPVSDAASVVIDGRGYLVGGEQAGPPLDTVISVGLR